VEDVFMSPTDLFRGRAFENVILSTGREFVTEILGSVYKIANS
jgi:hypothetical protein